MSIQGLEVFACVYKEMPPLAMDRDLGPSCRFIQVASVPPSLPYEGSFCS